MPCIVQCSDPRYSYAYFNDGKNPPPKVDYVGPVHAVHPDDTFESTMLYFERIQKYPVRVVFIGNGIGGEMTLEEVLHTAAKIHRNRPSKETPGILSRFRRHIIG